MAPAVSGGPHNVLFEPGGNYIIDFSQKHVSIFNKSNQRTDQPLQFAGTPVSASFRPSMGYLVVYDDTHTVGILKLDAQGGVLGSWMSGPMVNGNVTIASGDINDQGKLVLALSDNSIVVVDMDKTIAQNNSSWVIVNQFASGLSDIRWVAPVHDQPTQVLVMTPTAFALIDTTAGQVLGNIAISNSQTVTKTSKTYDPHFLVTSGSQVSLVYAQGSALKNLPNYETLDNVLSSSLNLAQNSWSVVDTTLKSFVIEWFGVATSVVYDDPNAAKKNRTFKRFTTSNLRAVNKFSLPDDAVLRVDQANIFELFPSPLGYAVNYGIANGSQMFFRRFNKPFEH